MREKGRGSDPWQDEYFIDLGASSSAERNSGRQKARPPACTESFLQREMGRPQAAVLPAGPETARLRAASTAGIRGNQTERAEARRRGKPPEAPPAPARKRRNRKSR